MTTEQQRAEFEVWAASIGLRVNGRHAENIAVLCAESAFKAGYRAGRAALQSQDREDAFRYRWLRQMIFDSRIIVAPDRMLHGEALDHAIDHARRVGGGGE